MLSSRDAYKHELTKLAHKNSDIIAVEADLGGKKHIFQKNHPERFFNFGIAEMASLDVCSGLFMKGYKPYFSTFASFVALRCAESIKLSLSYMQHNITIVSCYGGVSGGWFGTTHHCLEDMAIITTLPGIKIACPHGEEEVRDVIKESYLNEMPFYIRLYRNDKCNSIPNPNNKSYVIDGEFKTDYKTTLISIGEISTEMCRNIKEKISEVNHIHLIYVDKVSIESYAEDLKQILKDSKIVSVEEHRKTGSVSNLLLEILRIDMKIFTPNDLYPHMGGSHMDILEQLDFTEDKLETLIREV